MYYQFPKFAFAYVIAAILSFITAVIAWRRRSNPGNEAFSLLMLSLCVWSFASIFEAGALNVSDKLFWSKWQYIGIATLPPLWLYFSAEFTHQKSFDNRVRLFILVIPAITLALAFTNEYHNLLWSKVSVLPGPLHIGKYDHGYWFNVHIIFSYLLLSIGTYWLIKSIFENPAKRRIQIYIIVFGVLLGWIANILYVLGLFPITGFDPTPLSFTFIALLIFWNIFQFRLFDIVPIARELLLDNMTDGVIVLDADHTIVDINPAAQKIIAGENERTLLGLPIKEAFNKWGIPIENFFNRNEFHIELQLDNDPIRHIDLSVSKIEEDKKHKAGKIIIIRDITDRKIIELKESEQRKFAEALTDTAAIINSTLNLDEVLERILENVGKVVPHDTANIALVDVDHTVRFVRTKGYEKYGTENIVPCIEVHMEDIANLRRMAKTKKALINPDTNADPEWDRTIPGSAWIRSYMGAPIVGKGEVLGFINLDAATPDFYKEEYIPRLETFANQAAVAIENAQFFKEISDSANEMSILYEIGLAVTSGLGLEKTIKTLFTQLKKVAPIDLFYIALLDREENKATYFMYEGNGTKVDFGPISLVDQTSLTRYTIEKGETVYIPDALANDSEFPNADIIKVPGHNNRSIIGVPLVLRKEIQGALFLQTEEPNAYHQDQIWLIETIANQASIAMDSAQLFEKVQEMAIKDSLTGVYNRRYFYVFAENEIARSLRYKKDLSLIMIDIDHFKRVNDKFGHLIGDQTLKMVTEACLSVLRKVDVLCRFGGEEFVVLLPETSETEALVAAERICEVISDQSLDTDKGKVKVTVSIGITQLEKDNEQTLLDLVNEADQALYAAKNAGRNCVRRYSLRPK